MNPVNPSTEEDEEHASGTRALRVHAKSEQCGVVDRATTKSKSTSNKTADEADKNDDCKCLALKDHICLQMIDAILDLNLLLLRGKTNGNPGHDTTDANENELDEPVNESAHLNTNG